MVGHQQSLKSRFWWLVALTTAGSALLPAAAEAQARGTLQVYAQVVDTKVSYDGLQAAKVALQRGRSVSSAASQDSPSTLATVSVAYATKQQPALVLTIDYAKN